jgi:putative ABC transport system permease protein
MGALPAIRFSRPDVNESLQKGKRSSRFGHTPWRIGSLLVAGEVALVVILLAGAGLMVKSFTRLQSVELGLAPERVDFVTVTLPPARYQRSAAYGFNIALLQRIQSLPQIEAAAGVAGIPLVSTGSSPLTLPGASAGTPTTEPIQRGAVWLVTSDYFRTLRIRMVAGRAFTDREGLSNAPVAVLSESAARTGWPRGDALGSVFQNTGDQARQIIGIVGDVRGGFRSGVASRRPTVSKALFSVFAALGVILAAVGIFGVVAYMVSRRTHEIGVRMALGADAAAVRAMVVRQSLGPIACGLALGLIGALWLTRLLESSLFEVTPHDPATLIAVMLLLAGTALVAAYLPARRASRVDPMIALRAE